MKDINYTALVMLIEDSWGEFVRRSGSEEDADATLAALKKEAGMAA